MLCLLDEATACHVFFVKFLYFLSCRMLLWHGSRLTNWVGILSQGLRIAPPEAPVTGYMVRNLKNRIWALLELQYYSKCSKISNTTVKPVLSGHSKRTPRLIFNTDFLLMQVKSIAEWSKRSILQYIGPSLSYHLS